MTSVNDNFKLAGQVIKFYADGADGLSDEEKKILVKKGAFTEGQIVILSGALSDGVINGDEYEGLCASGIDRKFVAELAGSDGRRGLIERAKWLRNSVNALKFSSESRARMCRELGSIGSADDVLFLARASKDLDPKVRIAAIWALGKIGGDDAIRTIVSALDDRSVGVRFESAWQLGIAGNTEAVSALIEIVKDKNPSVRRAAIWALGQIGGADAALALIELSGDADPEVRELALAALQVIETREGSK